MTAENWNVEDLRNFFDSRQGTWKKAYDFEVSTSRVQLFAEASLHLSDQAALRAGWTWNHQGEPGATFDSLHLGFDFASGRSDFSISWGRSNQFPFFNQFFGPTGNLQLESEKADSVQALWATDLAGKSSLASGAFTGTGHRFRGRGRACGEL